METLPPLVAYGLIALVSFGLGFMASRLVGSKQERSEPDPETRARFDQLAQSQHELQGRLVAMSETLGAHQFETTRQLSERMDHLTQRLGQSMAQTSQSTLESLAKLNTRMAVIDAAQNRLGELSQAMVGLQDILANKQTRGSFGQTRMEAIIRDALPKDAFAFQAILSNNNRPDCLITLPDTGEKLVIDAKFPLESFTRRSLAKTPDDERAASQAIRSVMKKHITDIASRYFIPGETQDLALMFVPSESIYADLYEHFDDILQEAYRKRILIVGPSLLMLAVQLFQTMMRDAQMREQAGLIKKEVMVLLTDVGRLDERARKLQSHFSMAHRDLDDLLVSTKKIHNRGVRIEKVDVSPREELALQSAGSRAEAFEGDQDDEE